MRVLSRSSESAIFGPFTSSIQSRWSKRPSLSARSRLEDRTRDSHLDDLAKKLGKLAVVLNLRSLMARRTRRRVASLQLASRWLTLSRAGAGAGAGEFIRRHPHVFDVFPRPPTRKLCFRFSDAMAGLEREEERALRESEPDAVARVRRLVAMSVGRSVHVHALRLVRRELGLPEDFRDSILGKNSDVFRLVGAEVVELVGDGSAGEGPAEVEKWREREYREKWLSEFETRYAFPISFPTGFVIVPGFREKLKNWQRLPYLKPYEQSEVVRVRSCGGTERYEKRAVGVLHELLSLTVENMVNLERLVHFRRDLAMEVNVRELVLKHPGIFYVSIRGGSHRVFLREAYSRGRLIEPNPIYEARRKMLDLVTMGRRHERALRTSGEVAAKNDNGGCEVKEGVEGDGDWVIPMLESST